MKKEDFSTCPVCGNKNPDTAELISEVMGHHRIHCLVCNCAYINEDIQNPPVYDLQYNLHFFRPGDISKAWIMAQKLDKVCKRHYPQGRILEAGVGNGLTLLFLKAMGYDPDGVDIYEETCDFLKNQFGLTVKPGGFEKMEGIMEYDLIYSSHVIEHCRYPHEFIRTARRLLVPGGTLYLDTPDLDCSNNCDPNWHHFQTRHPLEHLCVLSKLSLEILASRNGFFLSYFEPHPEFGSFQAILVRT